MKKIFVTTLVILLSFSWVFAELIPPFPLTPACSGIGNGGLYDCFVNFFLYWLGFPQSTQNMNFFGAFNFRVLGRDNYYERNWGPPRFLMDILVPFVAVFLVTFGFMSRLRIFGRGMDWINVVLSFLMIIFIGRVHIFGYFVGIIFTIGPIYAFGIWALLFFTGIWFLFIKARGSMGAEAQIAETKWELIKQDKRQLRELMATEAQLLRQLSATDDAEKKAKIESNLDKVKARIDQVRASIQQMERQ